MSQTVEFKFTVGAIVTHVDLGIKGAVVSLMTDQDAVRWALVERATHDLKGILADWFRERLLVADEE